MKFNAAKPNAVPQKKTSQDNKQAVENHNKPESVLDEKILNFSNYLNLAYTNLHNI